MVLRHGVSSRTHRQEPTPASHQRGVAARRCSRNKVVVCAPSISSTPNWGNGYCRTHQERFPIEKVSAIGTECQDRRLGTISRVPNWAIQVIGRIGLADQARWMAPPRCFQIWEAHQHRERAHTVKPASRLPGYTHKGHHDVDLSQHAPIWVSVTHPGVASSLTATTVDASDQPKLGEPGPANRGSSHTQIGV
jgi:hypothetical protein